MLLTILSHLDWALIIFLLLAVGLFLYLDRRAERIRQAQLRLAAVTLGVNYVSNSDPVLKETLTCFDHSEDLTAGTFFKIHRGRRGNIDTHLFDHRFVSFLGRSRRSHTETMAMLVLEGPELPCFSLNPRGLLDKVNGRPKPREITFPENPEFTRRSILQGDDEEAIRQVFKPEVVAFFEAHPELAVSCSCDHLLVYQPSKRVAPENLHDFLENTLSVLNLLRA
jgi:hypothetical protein